MHTPLTAPITRFPREFLWGAATAAHQVEGDNRLNDWWEWEQRGGGKEPSGSACRQYERYEEDFDLARELNHNAHRFSIEWSRIEPEDGVMDPAALEHYRSVVAALKKRGLEPVVTLNHFTLPLWLARKGGWLSADAAGRFLRYVEYVVEALAPDVRFWVTINEPMIYVYHGYVIGAWPPQRRSLKEGRRVVGVLARAHIAAYRCIHGIYRRRKLSAPQVGFAQNVQVFEPCGAHPLNAFAAWLRNRLFNHEFVRRLLRARTLDYIGINYYSRSLVDLRGLLPRNILLDFCSGGHNVLPKNSLGWEIYPQGLYKVLMNFKRYRLPMFILENGICTGDDAQRWDFIRGHLEQLRRAMADGAAVLGYLYWSLIDNYEWDKGFTPRFGLIEVDYADCRRTVRESARKFSAVCAEGRGA